MILLSVQIYFITKAFSVREKVMNDGIKGMNGKMLLKIIVYRDVYGLVVIQEYYF